MAQILLYLAPTEVDGESWQNHPEDITLSRVPHVGEVVFLGNDAKGFRLDYRVALVVHGPKDVLQRDVDAEVYAVRVRVEDLITDAVEGESSRGVVEGES